MHYARNKGFTLVELMIVILIFGIVTAASLPGFGRFLQTWRLHGEVDQLASIMRTARSAAVMRNVDAVFQFDVNRGTYFYYEDNDGDGQRDKGEYRSSIFTLPSGIRFESHTLSAATLTFGPRGNTNESGAIILENSRQRTKQISIFGGTGNIRVGT